MGFVAPFTVKKMNVLVTERELAANMGSCGYEMLISGHNADRYLAELIGMHEFSYTRYPIRG